MGGRMEAMSEHQHCWHAHQTHLNLDGTERYEVCCWCGNHRTAFEPAVPLTHGPFKPQWDGIVAHISDDVPGRPA